jgi:nucleotide-binding universal stress UspA family protein
MSHTPTGPTIVVGVDGSSSSSAALDWAARQAEFTGAHVDVVIAWEWPTVYGSPYAFPTNYDPIADAKRVLDQVIAPAAAAHPKVEFRPSVTEGHPAAVLILASKCADLLVVGSRGYGEFAGMLLGSVSEHCVANAHCPVVVIRGKS